MRYFNSANGLNKYCLLADYNQFYIQILLLWREVAEDGAGNGFRDFVHV